MNRRNRENIILNSVSIDKYQKVNGLSLQNLFFVRNGYFPNCYMFGSSRKETDCYFDTEEILDKVRRIYGPKNWIEKIFHRRKFRYVVYRTFDFEENKEFLGINIIMRKENIYARIERSVTETYILYSHDGNDKMLELVSLIKDSYKKPEKEPNNLWLVAQDNNGFHLNKYKIKPMDDFDIAKHYNDDFLRSDKLITEFIEDRDRSGLIILHGEKGTGKTTYIRNIISKHPDSRFVFVPSNMIRLLGEPTFGNFLMSLKNDIIILEDCEDVIRTRKSTLSSSSAVSLLLNMGDGLLSDDLGIKFICTFNENISNIDDALLRKGRLACKYEFKPLCIEKSNALLSELYGDRDPVPSTFRPMSLADIYNLDGEKYENEKKSII